MVKTVYVKANSKRELNEMLANGEQVFGVEHVMGKQTTHDINELNDGDVIKVYSKTWHGNPIAKSYGAWSARAGRVK